MIMYDSVGKFSTNVETIFLEQLSIRLTPAVPQSRGASPPEKGGVFPIGLGFQHCNDVSVSAIHIYQAIMIAQLPQSWI